MWLLADDDVPVAPTVFMRRAAFLMLVVAAGLVGVALLIVPAATGSYFAWGLKPSPLAAFAGGVYVGSAALYGVGLARPAGEARALVRAAVVLSTSVLIVTLAHLDVFDFGRFQAWAWVALFATFAAVTSALAIAGHGRRAAPGAAPARLVRVALAAVALALGAVGVALWVDPGSLQPASPFALPPLGGRFAGSWIVMLAVLAGCGALARTRKASELPAVALIALPGGALLAAVRTFGEMDPARSGYVAALVLLCGVGGAALVSSR
jgi:hypothetical protein